MAKVTFVARKGSKKQASIQLYFNYGANKRLRYSTGLKVSDVKNWDTKKMRIKNVVAEIHKNAINNKLTDIQRFVEEVYTDFSVRQNIVVTNDVLKNELDVYFNKVKFKNNESQHLELLPFYKWYIEYYQKNPLIKTGKPMGKGTAKTYKNAFNILQKFNDTVYELNYEKVNVEFYDSFLNFMYEFDYSLNYIGTQIKILKTIMNASFEKDYHNNLNFKKSYFKKPNEEAYNIYLTENELIKMFNLDLAHQSPIYTNSGLKLTNKMLDQARDLFLISANSGLRVSDFNSLSTKNIISINGFNYISLVTKKNGKRLTIPINSMVKSILDKRNGNPPERMAEQHINYCLKELGKLAEIDEVIEKNITKGGVKVSKEFKKFELISNHTGRRSFCTNAYKSGMPTVDIMAISGHSTEKVFYNYIKVDDIERAEKISRHKFFG
ncbi:site-specific integrase [Tenacibaculum sp. Mcav3-52]|uniref:tyrosine-type recombinase/integrase n=1 Tax=Tenacibaculum sp. Mcav3-52 TaxID=2917762 RepID=UPI001EF1E95D|nr:tyrosine-type recombinase/integrase [Tenacibaculum sp. Mcav3-52]MCG7501773.1 site-specific integrase [Tenacibaculum sp. Mcav3-52]